MPTARDFDDKLTVYKEAVRPEMSKEMERRVRKEVKGG